MNILSVSCGSAFSPVVYQVCKKDAVSGQKTLLDDYTQYLWFCTVKLNPNDSDVDSLTGKVLNSSSDPERFQIDVDKLTIQALTIEDTRALNRDLTGSEESFGYGSKKQKILETIYLDVWFSEDGIYSDPIQTTAYILKPVSDLVQ